MPRLRCPAIRTTEKEELTPLYRVVLLDDDEHTYDYVVEMLASCSACPPKSRSGMRLRVDTTGRTVVITCGGEQAESAATRFRRYGADPRWRCQGPRWRGGGACRSIALGPSELKVRELRCVRRIVEINRRPKIIRVPLSFPGFLSSFRAAGCFL